MVNQHVFDQDDKFTSLNVTGQTDIVNCTEPEPTIISTAESPTQQCEFAPNNKLINRSQCGKGFKCIYTGMCVSQSKDDEDGCN